MPPPIIGKAPQAKAAATGWEKDGGWGNDDDWNFEEIEKPKSNISTNANNFSSKG